MIKMVYNMSLYIKDQPIGFYNLVCIYIQLSFSGVLAKEANTTLVDFPNDFYCDWPKQNVTITHRAGTTWPKAKLKKVWNGFVNKGIKIIQENLKPKI